MNRLGDDGGSRITGRCNTGAWHCQQVQTPCPVDTERSDGRTSHKGRQPQVPVKLIPDMRENSFHVDDGSGIRIHTCASFKSAT